MMAMGKRHSQESAGNVVVKLDGDKEIERCIECSGLPKCPIDYSWRVSGPIPMGCPLPTVREEE